MDATFDRFAPGSIGPERWTGPWVEPGFPLREIVASWNVVLPPGAVLEVEAQIARGGAESRWYSFGVWGDAERGSVPDQHDADAEMLVDILRVLGPAASRYRLRAVVCRAVAAPTLLAAMASTARAVEPPEASAASGSTIVLDVPALSQQVHRDRHPELDGGGASWCSPTSTAMVLAHWSSGPSAEDLAEIDAAFPDPVLPDPVVVHAARHVFDPAYGGAGNWSFNVAYAGRFGLEAFVTRLRSLREAELFLAAGIPLVLSIAAAPGALRGFPVADGTEGHLLVLVGVTAAGDAVVNDPAAPANAEVRRTYLRDELERAWLGGSGGIAYVIHPPAVELPVSRGNW